MKLSVAIPAFNSEAYIEPLLRGVRQFADEVVIGVDTGGTDGTERICARYADRLFCLEPIGTSERAVAWLNEQCTGDWILRLDDDELPSEGLVRALSGLLADREYTHYWLPRRWVIGRDQPRWIMQHPWWPDWQLRLFRNIRSLLTYPGHLHSECLVAGASGYATEGALYHYTLICHDEGRRRERMRQYEQISPYNSLAHYYFPGEGTVATRPIPPGDGPFRGDSRSVRRAIDYRRFWSRRGPSSFPPPYVSLAEIDAARREAGDYPPELFSASIDAIDCPERTQPGRLFPVQLRLRNDSRFIWHSVGLGSPTITLSYHLLDRDGNPYEFEGVRTNLPLSVRPGQAITVIAQVTAPWEEGEYVIRWDPVIENVAWFSTQAWLGPDTRFRASYSPDLPAELPLLAPYLRASERIPGWFRGEEAEALACAGYSLPGAPVIVEIGSFLGSSTVLLAGSRKVNDSGKLYCVDPFDASGDSYSAPIYRQLLDSVGGGAVRERFDRNIAAVGLGDWVEARQGTASEIAETWTLPIDMLVLDGDQSRAGARAAWDGWARFLKPGGIIAIHNSNDRLFAADHDGQRRLAVEELTTPGFAEIRLVSTTTFAVKTGL